MWPSSAIASTQSGDMCKRRAPEANRPIAMSTKCSNSPTSSTVKGRKGLPAPEVNLVAASPPCAITRGGCALWLATWERDGAARPIIPFSSVGGEEHVISNQAVDLVRRVLVHL